MLRRSVPEGRARTLLNARRTRFLLRNPVVAGHGMLGLMRRERTLFPLLFCALIASGATATVVGAARGDALVGWLGAIGCVLTLWIFDLFAPDFVKSRSRRLQVVLHVVVFLVFALAAT